MSIQKIQTGVIEDDSITTSKILNQNITVEKLASSGVLPALDGSQLTGITAGSVITKDSNDPAIDTNPSEGVGAKWVNIITGDFFICTDATTDANVWNNIGTCDGANIDSQPPGPRDAFFVGGARGGVLNPDIINYAFASSTESVHGTSFHGVNNPGSGINSGASHSSATDGYYSTGGSSPFRTDITRFSFASTGDAVGIGNTDRHRTATRQGTMSSTHGYIHGGTGLNVSGQLSSCMKFQFAESSTSSSGVFGLEVGKSNCGTHSTPTKGYVYGGTTGGGNNPVVIATSGCNEFLFSNDTTRVEIQSLNEVTGAHTVVGNNTNAYICGGSNTTNAPNDAGFLPIRYTRIDTHLLSSSASLTSHGDLTDSVTNGRGASTNTTGLIMIGEGASGGIETKKQTFSYASNVLATDLPDFAAGYSGSGACQTPATF
jgi:hypothetical protein